MKLIKKRTFARFEDERHAFPSRVVDPQRGGGKRRADGVRWDRVIVEIAGLAVCCDILTKQRVLTFNGWNRAENLDL